MLTQKSVVTDDTLSQLIGVPKGALLSYTELTRGLHAYIKSNKLRLKTCGSCNSQIPGYVTFCDKCGKNV